MNSSGLTIFLMQLLKYATSDNTPRSWHSDEFGQVPIIKEIARYNFFNIFNMYCPNISLFNSGSLEEGRNISDDQIIEAGYTRSFPIYLINFNAFPQRRAALKALKSWLYNALEPYYLTHDFILPQLASVITEIAKNSADHTSGSGFIGLDIIHTSLEDVKICFSIGDLGIGINQNIKNHLSAEQIEKRFKFWDLTQTYREALSRGFTTKEESMENKGLGMSLILDGARGINLSLSVFDANSRGILNNITSMSHSDIRRNFYNTGREVGFYYYGELNAKKI